MLQRCNFMEECYGGLREAVSAGLVVFNDTGKLMYDVAAKAQLLSPTHFHTWLIISPSSGGAGWTTGPDAAFRGESVLTDHTEQTLIRWFYV